MANPIAFCPQCHEEELEVTVEKSGKYFSQDYGEIHWFTGDGKCANCGWEGEYGDQSA